MKKTPIHLIVVFLGLLFQSCQSHSYKNDLEKLHLKGDITGLKIEGNMYFSFNDKGNIEKIIFFEDDKLSTISSVYYYYYVNNNLDKRIEKYRGESETILTKYIYDNDKHLLKKESNNPKFGHNETFYFYDKNWNVIKDSNVNLITLVNNYNYKNNEIVSLESKTIANGETHKNILKFKDEMGEFHETEQESKEIKYLKDSKGNWIKKQWNKDGENHQAEQTIFYRGQDISEYENKLKEFESNPKLNQSNSNNETTELSTQSIPQQKQWVNCRECHGTGTEVCWQCKGKGNIRCDHCTNGLVYGKTCSVCHGTGQREDRLCNGTGILGNCRKCKGRGQVQE